MFASYMSLALKTFSQNKQYALLSMLGLSIGMAVLILMVLFIQTERSFDLDQPNVANHYRLVMQAQKNGNEHILMTPRSKQQLLDIAGIESVFYLFKTRMVSDDKVAIEADGFQLSAHYAASSNILSFIQMTVLAGDITKALQAPEKIALARTEALRLFGSGFTPEALIGKTMTRQRDQRLLTVAAIFEDLPVNSHFYFQSLESFTPYENIGGNVAHTYVALTPTANQAHIAVSVTNVFKQIWQWEHVQYWLQPLADIHLGTNFAHDMKMGGSKSSVMICAVMTLILLVISCVNYVNFSVAQSANRAKEIGVRKALGASKTQLMTQFMSEAVVLTWFAMVLACVLVELFMTSFMHLIGRPIAFSGWAQWIGAVFIFATIIGVVSGIYPSVYMSSLKTREILSGELKQGRQGVWIRKGLLLIQITLSIGLLIGAMTLTKQLQFLQTLPVNYSKAQQWVINDMQGQKLYGAQNEAFFSALQQVDGVVSAVAMDFSITQSTNAGIFIENTLNPEEPHSMALAGVSAEVVRTLDLKLVAGRDFSRDHAADGYNDRTNQAGVILPESIVTLLGFTNAHSAIGQSIQFSAGLLSHVTGVIVGVVKDIKVGPVNHQSAPVVFVNGFSVGGSYSLVVKVVDGSDQQVKQAVVNFIKSRLNIAPVTLSLLEDDYQALYQQQQRLKDAVMVGSILSVVLIIIGVFGLTGFIVQQRIKEVAIRKVLGASRLNIVNALAKEFLVMIALGCLVAWPLAYIILADWLSGFALHVEQSLLLYVVMSGVVAVITWLTVASLAFKAASTRPSLVLRDE